MPVSVSMVALVLGEAEQLLPQEAKDLTNGLLANYGDFATLLVLADWFAENGEPDLEYVLRWMAKHSRLPQRWDSATKATGDYAQRDWPDVFEWTSHNPRNDLPCRLPRFLGGDGGVSISLVRRKTFLSAVVWLALELDAIKKNLEVVGM